MTTAIDSEGGVARWVPHRIREHLRNRPILAQVAGNIGWLVSERIVLLAAGFFVNIWFVRSLGPARYGTFSYAVSFAALFASLATAGMDTVVVRELARQRNDDGAILGTALAIRVLIGAAAWTACAASIWAVRPDATTRLLVILLGGQSIFVALGVFELWFQARIAARPVVLIRTMSALALHAARCAFIWIGASLGAFAALVVANAGATALGVAALYLKMRGDETRLSFDRRIGRALVRESWPLVIVGISIVVYMKIDQVMLAAMSGDAENGIYATAVALSELWYFLPMAIAATVFPIIVKAHDELSPSEFEARMQTFYDAMAVLGFAIAIPVALFATPIVTMLYGMAYIRSAAVLRIHVASFVFVCLGVARGRFLIARSLTKFNMLAAVSGALLNVVLNLVLIPRFGAIGAAWSTLISYAAANHFSSILDARMRRQAFLVNRALFVVARPQLLWSAITGRGSQ